MPHIDWKQIIRNKYVLVSLGFLIYVGFIDENNFLRYYRFRQERSSLQEQYNYYQAELVVVEEQRKQMDDPAYLEKFAREEYLMKKEKEELFIIVVEE